VTVKPPETPAETLTDSQKLDRLLKVAEHLDGMTHDVHQFITENKPHLEKALRFLDPGAAMRAYRLGRPRPGGKNG
jgi:ABC-type transporter Mla subunit MlaD